MFNESVVHSNLSGRKYNAAVGKLAAFDAKDYKTLKKLGIDIGEPRQMMAAMDAIQPGITTPSVTTPVQFLQEWLPGFVDIITAVRNIDELIGIQTLGSWEDEEVVQGVREFLNNPLPYGDYTNIPFASANINFVKRSIVRFEQGIRVGRLDQDRSARVRFDIASSYRESASQGLEIVRNRVGFYGYNGGANFTYGFLNDPNLLAYNTVANNGGDPASTQWKDKSYLQIVADILQMVQGLRTQSEGNIDPKRTPMTLSLANSVIDYLATVSDYGNSVQDWLDKTYPMIRVVSAPELDGANSGENVGYLYADEFKGTSTDGGQSMIQMVPAKFKVLGVEQRAKGYDEDYTNATAGTMVKRPFAIYRVTGI